MNLKRTKTQTDVCGCVSDCLSAKHVSNIVDVDRI